MLRKLTLQQLESFLWETADILRGNIDSDHKKEADDLGLSINELAFYNIMMAELANVGGDTVEESSVARCQAGRREQDRRFLR